MAINSDQLRKYIITPTLDHLGLFSKAAQELIVMTIAQESHGGTYVKQLGNGPACGMCQMEPATHDDIWRHYLKYNKELADRVRQLDIPIMYGAGVGTAEEMCGNNYYAVAMCRMHYLRVPSPLPTTIEGIAQYWKDHYNTHLGDGTVEQAIRNYERFG